MGPTEAAKLLCISMRTLTTLERDRGLPVHRLGRGHKGVRRYIATELLDWLAAQPSTPDPLTRAQRAAADAEQLAS
jgi:hypothetical protein